MPNRRNFVRKAFWGSILSPFILPACQGAEESTTDKSSTQESGVAPKLPIAIATWNNFKACEAAWAQLSTNQAALDAVEAGVKIPEADPYQAGRRSPRLCDIGHPFRL